MKYNANFLVKYQDGLRTEQNEQMKESDIANGTN